MKYSAKVVEISGARIDFIFMNLFIKKRNLNSGKIVIDIKTMYESLLKNSRVYSIK